MIWLSRFQIVSQDHRLYDCYDWHQFIWKFFPEQNKNDRPFIFRWDKMGENTLVTILSKMSPSPIAPISENLDFRWLSDPLEESFFSHTHYRFDLRANATRRDSERDGYNGRERKHRRFVLTKYDEQKEWIARNGIVSGFSLVENEQAWLEIDPREDFRFSRAGKTGLLVGTRFRGVLSVTDRDAFRNAVAQGIGRGRSLGFGLLMIQPVVV